VGDKEYNKHYYDSLQDRQLKKVTLMVHVEDVEKFKQAATLSRSRIPKNLMGKFMTDAKMKELDDEYAKQEKEMEVEFDLAEKARLLKETNLKRVADEKQAEHDRKVKEYEDYKKLNGFK